MIKIGFVSYVDGTSEILIKDEELCESVLVKCKLSEDQIKGMEKILGMCCYNKAKSSGLTINLSKEQIWYLVNVYPEIVSCQSAKKDYDEHNETRMDIDDSYWTAVANVINNYFSEKKKGD